MRVEQVMSLRSLALGEYGEVEDWIKKSIGLKRIIIIASHLTYVFLITE